MSEPVAWLVIERGWSVIAADGADVGRVEETVGDSARDIFNGLTVATGLLHKARYVPAEQVDEIIEGCVRLSISASEFERLSGYEEPPPQEQIRPE